MSNYLNNALTPANQREPAFPNQVQNNAGGFVFAVTPWTRLERFLILGAEGGTYYTTERKLTVENAKVVEALIKEDGPRLVRTVEAMSVSGRAPKNDPALLALAMAAKTGDDETRAMAFAALPNVARTGTHLYHFVSYANQIGGWGRGMKRAVGNWFNKKTVSDAAYQVVKYQSRDGWSARDLLRLAHPTPSTPDHKALYKWITQGADEALIENTVYPLPPIIEAFEEAKSTTSVDRLITLIKDYRLPREAIPTQMLTKPAVWEALLGSMGLTAMIRNLATMTKIGLLGPLADANKYITTALGSGEALRKSRVHPIQVLSAMLTYSSGLGVRGSSTWTPVRAIVDALDAAFYQTFSNVEPTGKPTLLALDVSGSMGSGEIAGIPGLSPYMAEAAMALVTANVETNYHLMGFSNRLVEVNISPKMRIPEAVEVMRRIQMGATDCAMPFEWAKTNARNVESFVTYTDNETWSGATHPAAALRDYRQTTGKAAKSAVVAFTATSFTIADPNDAGMMDFVGFDAAAPAVMADFFANRNK